MNTNQEATLNDLFDKALALQSEKKIDQAIKAYQDCLALDENHVAALINLGSIYRTIGQNGSAIGYFEKAFQQNPLNDALAVNYGNALYDLARFEDAIKIFSAAIPCQQYRYLLLNGIANCHQALGNEFVAIAFLNWAINEAPGDQVTRFSLARAQFKSGWFDMAEINIVEVLKTRANDPSCLELYGDILGGQNRHAEATFIYESVLAAKGESKSLLDKMGQALLAQKEFARATECFTKIIAIDRETFEAWYYLGICASEQGDYANAKTYFEKTLMLKPELAKAEMNLGQCEMAQGNFETGFKHYRARWRVKPYSTQFINFPYPYLENLDPKVKNLLIWGEQGIGDELMFFSILPHLQDQYERIGLYCTDRLIPIVQKNFPKVRCYVLKKNALQTMPEKGFYDAHIAIGDLFALYDHKAFLNGKAYLSMVNDRKIFPDTPGKLKVGLSWHTTNPEVAAIRSANLDEFLPILEDDRFDCYSVQYGEHEQAIQHLNQTYDVNLKTIPNLCPTQDMVFFSFVLSQLDFVVTIDNSTVHLAGALGTQTILLLPKTTEWRWPLEGNTCSWYESVRIFRKEGDVWHTQIQDAAEYMAKLLTDNKPNQTATG